MRRAIPFLVAGLIALLAPLAVYLSLSDSYHHVFLRPTGCDAARQLGLKPIALQNSCEVHGNFEVVSLSWVRIDGIDIAKSEVIAFVKTQK